MISDVGGREELATDVARHLLLVANQVGTETVPRGEGRRAGLCSTRAHTHTKPLLKLGHFDIFLRHYILEAKQVNTIKLPITHSYSVYIEARDIRQETSLKIGRKNKARVQMLSPTNDAVSGRSVIQCQRSSF